MKQIVVILSFTLFAFASQAELEGKEEIVDPARGETARQVWYPNWKSEAGVG